MADLFPDSDDEVTLTVNKNYAERYNTWRQKEEFQKLKDRHGEDVLKKLDGVGKGDGSSSSSEEEEDENAKELTQEVEKEFFRTLSCLKKRDPRIYDENTRFFSKESSGASHNESFKIKKEKEEKPLLLRDYERKLIVERGGKFSDDEETDNSKKLSERPASPSLVEEQKALKDSFKNILENSDGEEDEAKWGGMFKQREKTKEEMDKEEEDYREWLKGQKDQLPDKEMESDLKHLHDYWNDPNLDANEAFLRDYILNKRFLDSDEEDYIPSYNEIVHDSSEDLSEDERTVEKQEEFEHKYNFRFEEPDQEFIKRYPRTMENSLRRKDDRRKRKREEIRERKEHEKEAKREEIKQLKALKRKELMEKIEKIKLITGNAEVGFKDEDLEEDFNPEEYDKRMSELFNDEYYGVEEEEEEDNKPEFPELDHELELENWDEWRGETDYENGEGEADESVHHEPHCEDPDFIMDCDYDPKAELQRELIKASKKKKKHRRVSKFAEVLSKAKPLFNPEDQTFDDYVDEYYKLDFEDIIGDLPCRFKYRKVVPNNFGLTVDEILKADDKELNQWCSLKKAIQYRPENVELYDVKAYKRKAADVNQKKRTLVSLYAEDSEEEEDLQEQPEKKRKVEDQIVEGSVVENNEKKVKKKKRKKFKNTIVNNTQEGNQSHKGNHLAIDGVSESTAHLSLPENSKKKKKKRKKQKVDQIERGPAINSSVEMLNHTTTIHDKFKKKKMKHKIRTESSVPQISDSRLKAYGLNPKKFKNKLIYKKS